MLGKLLKYELKSTSRIMGVLYLAVLVVAAVVGFIARGTIWEATQGNAIAVGYGFVDHNDCNGFAAVLQKSAERGRISDAHASGSDLDACCIKNNLFSDLDFT